MSDGLPECLSPPSLPALLPAINVPVEGTPAMSDHDDDAAVSLGAHLRWLRVNGPHGYIKMRDAARRANVSPPQWSRWEADRERPDRDLLASRICPMLGGDLGELLRLWENWVETPPLDFSHSICCGRKATDA